MDVLCKNCHSYLRIYQKKIIFIMSVIFVVSIFFPPEISQWMILLFFLLNSYLLLQNLEHSKNVSPELFIIHKEHNTLIYQVMCFALLFYIVPTGLSYLFSDGNINKSDTLKTFAGISLYITIFGSISIYKSHGKFSSLICTTIMCGLVSFSLIILDLIFKDWCYNKITFWYIQAWVLAFNMRTLVVANIIQHNSNGVSVK